MLANIECIQGALADADLSHDRALEYFMIASVLA